MKGLKDIPLELCFWVVAIVLLASANPTQHHFMVCPIANLGFNWCPGCGLGRSIMAIFNGDINESLKQHWLGIPALLIILHRIYQLLKQLLNKKNFKKYKEA